MYRYKKVNEASCPKIGKEDALTALYHNIIIPMFEKGLLVRRCKPHVLYLEKMPQQQNLAEMRR